MTKEKIINHLEYLKIAAEIDAKPESINAEIIEAAIQELKKEPHVVANITFDKTEMQRSVDKAAENIRESIIAVFIDDLNEIYQELWDVDIPSPTVPEYREHHEQIQGIMAVVTEKLKKWQEET